MRRLYTVLIALPIVYGVIRYLPAWALTVLVVAGGSLALRELYLISFIGQSTRLLTGIGLVTSALVIAHQHLPITLPTVLILGVLAVLTTLLRPALSENYRVQNAAVALFGVLYLGITLSTLIATRALPNGELLVLFVLLVTWGADTGAYYVGTLWGKHRLAPAISPKKSYEGLAGGILLAVVIAALTQSWLLPHASVMHAVALGLLLTATGLLGDLCESAIKRSVGVKDSGGLLPGHGGMLDRMDSLLFTAPTFYYYVTVIHGLVPLP